MGCCETSTKLQGAAIRATTTPPDNWKISSCCIPLEQHRYTRVRHAAMSCGHDNLLHHDDEATAFEMSGSR
eukprot:1946105-Amphidinium_carterae.2